MGFTLTRLRRLDQLPIYPVLLASSIILNVFLDSGSPWSDLWRPLAISIAVTSLVLITLWAVVRSRHAAAFAASVIVLLVGGLELLAAAWLGVMLLARLDRLRRQRGPFP